MERTKPNLVIKVTYDDAAYLFTKNGNKQTYVAKLNQLDVISSKLGITKEEAFKILLELVRERLKNTNKEHIRTLMEDILFDPNYYFGMI